MQLLRDTWLIFRRSMWLTLRQPDWLIFGLIQPVLYLVLFGPLLEGAVTQAGSAVSAYNWFVPGLLVQVALFGAAFVGFGLIAELRSGVVERMRVTPMSRTAMLLGRSLRDVVILLVQALILIVLSIPFGLQLDPAGSRSCSVLLALIGLAVAPLSYAVALALKSEDAFAPLIKGVTLPLLLLSGILLPMALAPEWLQTLSTLNPLTHAVDAARALFNGQWGDPEILIGTVRHERHGRHRRVGREPRVHARQRLTRSPLPRSRPTARTPRGIRAVAMSVAGASRLLRSGPCPTDPSRCSSRSPASTATTAAPRCSPAACATRASRSSTRASARRPRWSPRPRSRRTSTWSGCRSCRAPT